MNNYYFQIYFLQVPDLTTNNTTSLKLLKYLLKNIFKWNYGVLILLLVEILNISFLFMIGFWRRIYIILIMLHIEQALKRLEHWEIFRKSWWMKHRIPIIISLITRLHNFRGGIICLELIFPRDFQILLSISIINFADYNHWRGNLVNQIYLLHLQ